MATLEQVEKLREKANVSYDDAKAALDATNGDILEALIYLEKQGKVNPPAGGGYYSSERPSNSAQQNPQGYGQSYGQGCCQNKNYYNPTQKYNDGETFGSVMKKIGRTCLKIIQKGNTNNFEVLKGGESKAVFPITVLVLLIVFAFWITVPLIIVGLFFGFRYRFVGPDCKANSVNDVMDSAANAAENLKNTINK
jgi:hypothetical protein